jgi:hypothetical protein
MKFISKNIVLRAGIYIIILLVSLAWFSGCSRQWHRQLSDWGIIADDYRFGDLYRMSSLPQFKALKSASPKQCPSQQNESLIGLYIIGDSFTEPGRIDSTDFCTQRFFWTHWKDIHYIKLNPQLKNILILETVERHILDQYTHKTVNFRYGNGLSKGVKNKKELPDYFFPKANSVEEKLERLLSSSNAILWLKEAKASITQKYFDRIDDRVAVSEERNQIFYKMDTDTAKYQSSYHTITDSTINRVVEELNKNYIVLKKAGFEEVYISMIPNKASVFTHQNSHYNHIIERIQQNPSLKIPIINTYSYLSTYPSQTYEKGDSHWNNTGRMFWIEEVNKKIKQGY